MNKKKLNIAIIGYGIAGKARETAIKNMENISLMAIHSRRKEFSTHHLEEILENKEIKAVAISTENTLHETLIEQCLNHQKHILVDYPACFSVDKLNALKLLANQKKCCFHIEHIGCLTKAHQEVKNEISTQGNLINGSYFFQGGWNPKIANVHYSGPLAFLAYSRLIQLGDLFGEFNIIDHNFKLSELEYHLQLELKFKNQGSFRFEEYRKEGLKRSRTFQSNHQQGPIEFKPNIERGLFQKDLELFVDEINYQQSYSYIAWETIINVTHELEKISSRNF